MAVHIPDQEHPYEDLPPSINDGQWNFVTPGDVNPDRMPQYNGVNLSSAQLGRTAADGDTSEVPVMMATAQMGEMDLGDKSSDFEMEDDYAVSHYPGSNNSGASDKTPGGETDRPRYAPVLQGAPAPKPQRLTAEMLDIHTRQASELYTYPDSTGGWVQRTGPALWGSGPRRSNGSNPLKRGSTSIVSEASSAWIPVPSSSSGISQDIAGVGHWASEMVAPHHHRRG